VLLVATVVVCLIALAFPFCAIGSCGHESSGSASCDMFTLVRAGLNGVLPPISSSSLPAMIGIVALAVVALVAWQWTPRKSASVFARTLSPPGSLSGVRLLI
jgi:hypothetical protein